MTPTGDPWGTLGLTPGASLDEVRRAYRRLAKANHPDAAGESALPRFLAIQAAYEQIAGPRRTRRPGSRPAGGSEPDARQREPWRADPGRARASGRADGRRPGARPGGRPAEAPPGARPTGPNASQGDERPGGGRPGTSGPRRRSSSRRPPKTATPYSTSYDPADEEPFEPGWTGGTWYGASSGTYWTINPKEYADPRKHGPEYQARARRAQGGWILDDEAPEASEPSGEAEAADETADETTWAGAAAEPAPEPAPGSTTTSAARPAPGRPRSRSRPSASGRRPEAWRAADAAAARAGGAGEPPFGRVSFGCPSAADDRRFHGPFLPRPTSPTGRLATALLGWPPLGLFAAAAIGESTGCGRYAASCGELSSPGTWVVSIAILLLLLAVPAVAAWSAHGTIAAVLIGVPSAVILSAAGGTNMPEASGPLLVGVLAIAYLAGVAYALLGPRLAAAT